VGQALDVTTVWTVLVVFLGLVLLIQLIWFVAAEFRDLYRQPFG
jgi:hypothetical protein